MDRYTRVLAILDAAVGGPTAPVGAHGAFWRGLSRNQFVAKKVFGLPLIVVGDPGASNLVKALAGEVPFGADLPNAPKDASYNRMPSGRPPVAPDDLAFIKQWIADGCPEEPAGTAESATRPGRPTRTVVSLLEGVASAAPTLDWLKEALQLAIQLELSTLPPYLTARWTIKNVSDPVAESIGEIRFEEMLHFGLACNLLVAVGGTPRLANADVVPKYPGPLPGGVRPGLEVKLTRLTKDQLKVFMEIEYPQGGPIPTFTETPTYNSIGEFYGAILLAFQTLNPPLDLSRQFKVSSIGLFKIETPARVKTAIDLINLQGEGNTGSPEETTGDLAHYYRFAEIYQGKKLVQNPTTQKWSFTGPDLPMPDTWPMADVPKGGYLQADVSDPATWNLIATFDQQFSQMLRNLESAWVHGVFQYLSDAVNDMRAMGDTAGELIQIPKPDGSGNYGPCFRYVT